VSTMRRAAAALKVPPADLTTLAQRKHGKFPNNKVFDTIKGDGNTPAHGSEEMPMGRLVPVDEHQQFDQLHRNAADEIAVSATYRAATVMERSYALNRAATVRERFATGC
jgi:hypothetical protein